MPTTTLDNNKNIAFFKSHMKKYDTAISRWRTHYEKASGAEDWMLIDFKGHKHTYMSKAAFKNCLATYFYVYYKHTQ